MGFNNDGKYEGQLMDNGNAITIEGLWALTFSEAIASDKNHLVFTAGPNEEINGLYGYLKLR